jgi:hypothetical protein
LSAASEAARGAGAASREASDHWAPGRDDASPQSQLLLLLYSGCATPLFPNVSVDTKLPGRDMEASFWKMPRVEVRNKKKKSRHMAENQQADGSLPVAACWPTWQQWSDAYQPKLFGGERIAQSNEQTSR